MWWIHFINFCSQNQNAVMITIMKFSIFKSTFPSNWTGPFHSQLENMWNSCTLKLISAVVLQLFQVAQPHRSCGSPDGRQRVFVDLSQQISRAADLQQQQKQLVVWDQPERGSWKGESAPASPWLTALVKGAGFLRGEQRFGLVKVNRGGVWRASNWRYQLENWRYATQPVCQSWVPRGQLNFIAMMGGIMGRGDEARLSGHLRRPWRGRCQLFSSIMMLLTSNLSLWRF